MDKFLLKNPRRQIIEAAVVGPVESAEVSVVPQIPSSAEDIEDARMTATQAKRPKQCDSQVSESSGTTSDAVRNISEVVGVTFSRPNHADQSHYPEQQLGNTTRRFQNQWYALFAWLHKEPTIDGALCFYCAKAGEQSIAKNAEPAFTSVGFRNWNRAKETFLKHESSCAHKAAIAQWLQQKKPLLAQLSTQYANDQLKARNCLISLLKCIRYLARQGIPLRGHEELDGNYSQLRLLCADFDGNLKAWLERYHDYSSPEIQNEMLNLMSNAIIRGICKDIWESEPAQPAIFSLIVDGTRDITGVEQESVCIRYVNNDLQPLEVFIGFYEATCTTGDALSLIVFDVLQRLGLPLERLRGQTYDGAANMSGKYNGAQAIIRQKQPLALFVHCSTHCINLVTETAISASPVVRDSVDVINELGVLSSQSGKFKNVFAVASSSHYSKTTSLKPLCPTRWTVRAKAIRSVLDQYEAIIEALEEMSSNNSNAATRAAGLLDKFRKGATFLTLQIALQVIEPLEILNTSLQGRQSTVGGMRKAVTSVQGFLELKRDATVFETLMVESGDMQAKLDLDEISAPRQRRPPKRFTGLAEPFHPDSAMQYYRLEYFKVIDTALAEMNSRFNQDGLKMYEQLEQCLLTGTSNDTCLQYPEIDAALLRVQLPMFKMQFQYNSTDEAATSLRSSVPQVRLLFNQVETLIRLLLVVPATSCEAERSFSGLRRLKTWLRSTMTQKRFNSVAVCNVHSSYIDKIDLYNLANDFISVHERREQLFGKF